MAGGVALASRFLRSLFRAGLTAAEKSAVDGLLEVSVRQGDLTAMAERRERAKALRRARLRSGAFALLWLALLVLPLFSGWLREVYALASVLWLVPSRPVLPRRAPREP